MAKKNQGFAGFDLNKATKKLKKLAEINAKSFMKLHALPDFPKMNFDTLKNLDLKDTMGMVEMGKKGFNMMQENLDHPLVKEGLDKLNDIDAIKKLKEVDVGEVMNKLQDMGGHLEEAKLHASNFFKFI
jgi:hypothetical protein